MSEPQDNNEATNDVALLIRYLQQDQLEKQPKRQNPMGLTTIYARRVVLLWLLCGVIGVMVLIILAGAIVSLKTREPTADTSLFHRFNVQSVTPWPALHHNAVSPADKALTPQLARWGQQIYQVGDNGVGILVRYPLCVIFY